ncbi:MULTISPECIES: glycosyl hydrolase [Asticcacaulis]|uniref:glycosyl hydrolase n=1 Tax=Asticcacaulis TaxID=76890 RepID=UPI001FDA8A15|nr:MULTISPECIES: glycosyl hydrolase [Asticcacaulis]MBP2160502.1 mannan endo-1,4-beta-mannosidase [Asticcacaulis solisilvae]MDR6801547.1 mannan endo-1,4-beta-mannosidase [Asticcacaulis sp. BE141]
MAITKRQVMAGLVCVAATASIGREAMAETRSRPLSNPNASGRSQALYDYLWDIWGQKTLTGQQESMWVSGPQHELDYIERVSGKLPAILGLDYIHPQDNTNVNARAIAWYKRGGIPSICWHWGNPLKGPGYESSKTRFDVVAALVSGSPENRAMMRDMATIADLLTEIRDADVPVLWRPFHEFTGDWFWWGMHGGETFRRLWILMYDYFTHERGLNNLIWVLGYTKDPSSDYFPGMQYVDIAAADNYVDHTGPQKDMFDRVVAVSGQTLPIALHENGPIPDPDQLGPSGAQWLWFLTWHSQWITSDKFNTAKHVKAVYNSDRYITLDELPDLREYKRQ